MKICARPCICTSCVPPCLSTWGTILQALLLCRYLFLFDVHMCIRLAFSYLYAHHAANPCHAAVPPPTAYSVGFKALASSRGTRTCRWAHGAPSRSSTRRFSAMRRPDHSFSTWRCACSAVSVRCCCNCILHTAVMRPHRFNWRSRQREALISAVFCQSGRKSVELRTIFEVSLGEA